MALTYTVAGLRSELDALETARKARDWATAYDEYLDYLSVWSTLPKSEVAGSKLEFPRPEDLLAGLQAAQAAIDAEDGAEDGRRLIRTRCSHG